MKKILFSLIFLLAVAACKKKEQTPATFMTVISPTADTFAMDDVRTNVESNGDVVIIGRRSGHIELVSLTIRRFQAGLHTYNVRNTATGTESQAYYTGDGVQVNALYGEIVVSSYTSDVISGTFTFQDALTYRVNGSFTAATH